ncbi:MAG: hypothetical protein JWP48_5997 [Actinoallomurus sp.]|nr:hypothetical protein [Actinoallomurus sp.]
MLLTLTAGGMAVVATTDRHDLPAGLLVDAGMVTMGLTLLVLLWAVRPRLGTSGFLHHARGTADGVRAELAGCDVRTWRSRELTSLSRIARRKYELLRSAVDLLSVAVVLVLAGTGLG